MVYILNKGGNETQVNAIKHLTWARVTNMNEEKEQKNKTRLTQMRKQNFKVKTGSNKRQPKGYYA